MSEELKPCPFCGGEAEQASVNSVDCTNCDASVSIEWFIGMKGHEAIAAWNRRPDAARAEGLSLLVGDGGEELMASGARALAHVAKATATDTPHPAGQDLHRFGSPPEPVVNPSEAWCDAYADWYYQGRD